MSEEAQHHVYSASGAEGHLSCPGKRAMEQGITDKSSPFADEGSAAHYLAAHCLTKYISPESFIGRKILCWSRGGERDGQNFEGDSLPEDAIVRSEWVVTQEMANHIAGYREYIRKQLDDDTSLFIEERVHFGDAVGIPGAFGTADCIIIRNDGSYIRVIDLKYGYNPVNAEWNAQLLHYAAGVIEDFGAVFDFSNLKTITLEIYQPRVNGGNSTTWTCTLEDLNGFLEKAKDAYKLSEEALLFFNTPNLQFDDIKEWQKEYLRPSDKGCKWCKRKGDCPALAEANMAVVLPASADGMEDLDAVIESPLALPEADFNAQIDLAIANIPKMPFDTVAKVFGSIRRLEDWIKAIEARMLEGLLNGEAHPDWKLVQGKQGNRAWTNVDEVEAVMKSLRLKVDEMYDKTIISPSSAEKLLKKDRKKHWDKLSPFITRSEGKIAVAPVTDKREALNIQDKADDMPILPSADGIDTIDFI